MPPSLRHSFNRLHASSISFNCNPLTILHFRPDLLLLAIVLLTILLLPRRAHLRRSLVYKPLILVIFILIARTPLNTRVSCLPPYLCLWIAFFCWPKLVCEKEVIEAFPTCLCETALFWHSKELTS